MLVTKVYAIKGTSVVASVLSGSVRHCSALSKCSTGIQLPMQRQAGDCIELSNLSARYSNRAHMQTLSRTSRHATISRWRLPGVPVPSTGSSTSLPIDIVGIYFARRATWMVSFALNPTNDFHIFWSYPPYLNDLKSLVPPNLGHWHPPLNLN